LLTKIFFKDNIPIVQGDLFTSVLKPDLVLI
jgi:hypothetical protein